MNAVHLLFNTADRLPNKAAVVYENDSMTYAELKEKVLSFATGLKNKGIRENMHVSLLMTNRPEYIISYFAILTLGATAVPLNPQFKEKELTYALNDSESQALIYDDLGSEVVKEAKGDFTSTKILITFRGEAEWMELIDHEPFTGPVRRSGEDTAQIIYTSGTTGSPKGAMITHHNITWMTNAMTEVQGTNEQDRMIVSLHCFMRMPKWRVCGARFIKERAFFWSPFIQTKFSK